MSVIDASESDSLASASLVSVSIDGGAAEADLSSLDVSSNGDVIHDSTGLGRVIPVVHFVFAHIFERESTVEVLADVATNILSQHESATWVIEEILLHVNDEVIDDSDLMAGLDHLHELVVRDLSWWSSEWDFLSPIKLMPNFEEEDETIEPEDRA